MRHERLLPSDLEFEPPTFDLDLLRDVVVDLYGVAGTMSRLDGERDQNVLVEPGDGPPVLLKVSGVHEDPAVIDLRTAALRHLERVAPELPVPRVLTTLDGRAIAEIEDSDGRSYGVRLLSFLPGETFDGGDADGGPLPPEVHRSIGAFTARVGVALSGFEHPAADHFMAWDLNNGLLAGEGLWAEAASATRGLVAPWQDHLMADVLPRFEGLRSQVIHNDVHGGNLLRRPGTHEICGLIDFGDIVLAPLVQDLGVAAAEFLDERAGGAGLVAEVAAGFDGVVALTDDEIDLLPGVVLARLVQTALLCDFQVAHCPGNAVRAEANGAIARAALRAWTDTEHAIAPDLLRRELRP